MIHRGLEKTDIQLKQIQNQQLDISSNKQIDIAPLKDLTCLIKLDMSRCGLRQLSALKSLINLQFLDISYNSNVNITALQYLKSLTHLYLNNCNIVSLYVLRPLANLEELRIASNKIVYLDANLNEMKYLEELRVQYNLVGDFSQIEKRQNFNNIGNFQDMPSQEELHTANKMRRIEGPNVQLKYIKHKTIKTTLNNCKQKINVVMNRMCSNHVQFSSSIVRLFQQLDQFRFE
ncbi:Chain_A [Hexamita inflata]|uniref:Leucine Rich Repeat Protein n=1 Tax=Hexamita inflata TaxID=28002 RepID=A0AA86PQP2_9EUKA|nr:Chain A [Hexamita inflata]